MVPLTRGIDCFCWDSHSSSQLTWWEMFLWVHLLPITEEESSWESALSKRLHAAPLYPNITHTPLLTVRPMSRVIGSKSWILGIIHSKLWMNCKFPVKSRGTVTGRMDTVAQMCVCTFLNLFTSSLTRVLNQFLLGLTRVDSALWMLTAQARCCLFCLRAPQALSFTE